MLNLVAHPQGKRIPQPPGRRRTISPVSAGSQLRGLGMVVYLIWESRLLICKMDTYFTFIEDYKRGCHTLRQCLVCRIHTPRGLQL